MLFSWRCRVSGSRFVRLGCRIDRSLLITYYQHYGVSSSSFSGECMKRYGGSKKHGAKSFERRADRTMGLNLANPRRGGIRL